MGTPDMNELVRARASALGYYSPYYFMRQLSAARQQELFGAGLAARWNHQAGAETVATGPGQQVHWLLQQLPWDTAYFGTPTVRLFSGLFNEWVSDAELTAAAAALRHQLAVRYGSFYSFTIVPTQDVRLLQNLTAAGWRLVETRLAFYRDQLDTFEFPRFPVRAAQVAEAAAIGQVAALARNPYDRFHADSWFGDAVGDAFLARYAENTITTPLAATVLVPDEPGLAVDAFLSISDLSADAAALNTKLSRVLLTAVGPANRGWHLKLMAETLHRARALGHEAVLMTTQPTNQAVLRTTEKLGFRLGGAAHVLACSSSQP